MTRDKVLHFLVNLALSLTGFISYWLAVGLCVGASFGKEVGDALAKGASWDWKDSAWDLLADALGMGTGLLVVFLIRRFG